MHGLLQREHKDCEAETRGIFLENFFFLHFVTICLEKHIS